MSKNLISLLFIFFLGCSLSLAVEAGAAAPPADRWIELARHHGLAHRTEWLRLLHYQDRWFGPPASPALGKLFFLSQNGMNDPEAELEATLRGFFRELTPQEKIAKLSVSVPGQPDPQPPQCQFPARLIWLQKELGFQHQELPSQNCVRYEHFVSNLAAKSVTLIFSSYYLNNPSSAFGHTFLRLNKAAGTGTDPGKELLDYGINYAAVADTGNAFLYAFKGLAGLFPGTFTSVPYYYKIREYNDYESRDLWEYNLSFSPEQTAFLVAHLWELGSTYFRYFYLTQNCSYQVIALLDVVDPQLHLVDELPSIVIPADTVKLLNRQPGLVTDAHYRPSIRTQFDYRIGLLSKSELKALEKVIGEKERADFEKNIPRLVADLPTAGKVGVLDAAADYIEQRYSGELLNPGKKSSPASQWKQALLLARSEIAEPSAGMDIPPPWQEMPQLGHGSRRISLDSGYSTRFGVTAALDYRYALHDLSDATPGYPGYAQIEMGNIRFRYNTSPSSFWLDDLTAFRIVSLNPIKPFDHKLSWTVSLQAKRFYDGICQGTCFGPSFEVGGGIAKNPFAAVPLTTFLLGTGELIASPTFPGAHFRPGVGPTFGIRYHPTDQLGMTLQSGYRYRVLPGPHDAYFTQWLTRWSFRKDLAMDAQISHYLSNLLETTLGISCYY